LRSKKGFTLVEVIVVLVILAILAAIAIPALTGYIAKAEDKKYIAQARNISVAMKTVINEAYASGKMDRLTDEQKKNFTPGYVYDGFVDFGIEYISRAVYGSGNDTEYFKQAATLIGEVYPEALTDSGAWEYWPLAQKDSGATAATADGFVFAFFPEGMTSGSPAIGVTYKLQRLAAPGSTVLSFTQEYHTYGVYDSNAGYEVYKGFVVD
jgi:prepilin-type N-terminal cleavage/methylation domain-containing protein